MEGGINQIVSGKEKGGGGRAESRRNGDREDIERQERRKTKVRI